MAKKMVVRRNLRKRRRGGAPYLKYLVFAALALIFLVVITPYLVRDKSREATEKRPLPYRGAITKELPKLTPQQPAPGKPAAPSTATKTPGAVKPTAPVASAPAGPPVSVRPSQTQAAPKPAQKALASSGKASPAQTQPGSTSAAQLKPSAQAQPPQAPQKTLFPASPKASAPVRPAQAQHTAPKVLFPKQASSSQTPVGNSEHAKAVHAKVVTRTAAGTRRTKTASSAKPAPNPGTRHGAAHALRPGVTESYAVQVGSIFRTFGQAQALRRRLTARGYSTAIRHVSGLGYLVVTSAGAKSKAYTLLAQMNAEGLTNAKVVPVNPNAR